MAKSLIGYQLLNVFTQGFNDFWSRYFGKSDDYMQRLKPAGLVEMKKVFSGINGIVTILTEATFIRLLEDNGIITKSQRDEMISHIRETSPYTNGYDIRDDNAKIIAEVKCNFPVDTIKFGPAQINALIKDINGLHNPKLKTKEHKPLPEGAHKFLVLLCEDKNSDNFNAAVEDLIRHAMNEIAGVKLEILNVPPQVLSSDTIYIVKVSVDELDLNNLTT